MAMFWFKYMKIIKILFIFLCFKFITHLGGGGDTRCNGLYGEAPPKRSTFSGFRYMKR